MFKFSKKFYTTYSRPSSKNIRSILRFKPIGDCFVVEGWLKSLRKHKNVVFIHLDDGSCLERLQVVVPQPIMPKGLTFHACISIEGSLVESKGAGQDVEFVADKVEVLSQGAPEDYPFTEKMAYHKEDLRLVPQFRSRVRNFASMLRIRSHIKVTANDYFEQEDFINMDTPLLTSNDCEGNGNAFAVKGAGEIKPYDASVEVEDGVFGHPVYLTVSGQLHLEAMANGLSKVYCCNPAFRAEGGSRMHLNEFWMIEAEECLGKKDSQSNYQLLMDRIEGFIKFTLRNVLDHCQDDVEFQWKFNKKNENYEAIIQKAVNNVFLRIPYSEVLNILESHKSKLKHPIRKGENLNKECELFLTEHSGGIPIFVTDWPIHTKPFYMLTDDERKTAYGIDLLVPRVGEVLGGGLREHRVSNLTSRVEEKGLAEMMQWYVDLRKWGYEPTGGFGLGLERFIMYLLGIENIQDTIPYQRSNRRCLC